MGGLRLSNMVVSEYIPEMSLYVDTRTKEFPQCARGFKANYCSKVHNTHRFRIVCKFSLKKDLKGGDFHIALALCGGLFMYLPHYKIL